MLFVEWEGEKLLKVEVEEFSYMEDMFNSSLQITLFPNEFHKNITDYITNWSDLREIKNLVVYYKNEKGIVKYYHLREGIPNLVNINTKGMVSSCKFHFNEMKEISRPLKISEILND